VSVMKLKKGLLISARSNKLSLFAILYVAGVLDFCRRVPERRDEGRNEVLSCSSWLPSFLIPRDANMIVRDASKCPGLRTRRMMKELGAEESRSLEVEESRSVKSNECFYLALVVDTSQSSQALTLIDASSPWHGARLKTQELSASFLPRRA
jgi:hypothetical protein